MGHPTSRRRQADEAKEEEVEKGGREEEGLGWRHSDNELVATIEEEGGSEAQQA